MCARHPYLEAMEQALSPIADRYADRMSQQIAIRIPDDQLEALDQAIEDGAFESRAHAVREGLRQVLVELREQEIAQEYREAYTRYPDDPKVGRAGAKLLAEAFRREEEESK